MGGTHHNDKDELRSLAAALDAFAAAWDRDDEIPSITQHLGVSSSLSDALRREWSVEFLKLDLEQRWQRGLRKLVEDYADDVPQLATVIEPGLLLEEYRIRKAAGDAVSSGEYFERFPDLAGAVADLFRVDPSVSRSLTSNRTAAGLPELRPGERVDDFDLIAELGCGAFATVFLARQRTMQRLVALKVSADQGTEPQTLAQLDHDHIIRVYDQRTLTEPALRLLYMQYASGGTLQDVIRSLHTVDAADRTGQDFLQAIDHVLDARGETRPAASALRGQLRSASWPELVCRIGRQLADGLDYAHRASVLHRDLKPANILLMAEGIPKIADFNISFGATVEGDSAEQNFGGSLAWMSPEQLAACHPDRPFVAVDLDARSDQFSLGVVLFELLTGQRPFRDESGFQSWPDRLTAMIQAREVPLSGWQLSSLGIADESGLADVLRRMLAADRNDRFSSCGHVATALDLCVRPDARRLLQGAERGWLAVMRRWPVTSVVSATLLPNLVAAVFNFLYNRGEIRTQLPTAESAFMRIQTIINLIAFPVGIACVAWLIRSVTKSSRTTASPDGKSAVEQRAACLRLGGIASMVGLTLWLLAAPAYPLLLHLRHGAVPAAIYGHFMASLLLCGLIAAAYPFLGVSLIVLRCLLPTMIRTSGLVPVDQQALRQLLRQSWIALSLAAALPMVAVLVLALSGLDRRAALVVLATGGTVGFGLAVSAFRLVQKDVQTLLSLTETPE